MSELCRALIALALAAVMVAPASAAPELRPTTTRITYFGLTTTSSRHAYGSEPPRNPDDAARGYTKPRSMSS
jgi:hypothetical protein